MERAPGRRCCDTAGASAGCSSIPLPKEASHEPVTIKAKAGD